MKAIYACKLYKSSPRKDKIKCAMQNPVNAELVAQLAEHLDEEYQSPAYLSKESKQSHDLHSPEPTDGSENNPSQSHSFGGGHSSIPSGGGFDADLSFDEGEGEGDSFDTEDVSDGEAFEVSDLEGEGDSLDVDSTAGDVTNPDDDVPIQEATDIEATEAEDEDSKSSSLEVTIESVNSLKDVMNTSSEVAGVDRAQLKDNEVWFYYNDSVNLNNVMTPVIELISNSGYELEFNRLARSVNAIVFQIGPSVIPEVVEYESETA